MSRGKKALLGIVLFSLLVPALTVADPGFKLDPNCTPVFRLSSVTSLPGKITTVDICLENAIPTSGLNLLGISSFLTLALWGSLLIGVIAYRSFRAKNPGKHSKIETV